MSKLKITLGEWGYFFKFKGSPENHITINGKEHSEEPTEEDFKLIADVGNTYQKCGLLPSELLELVRQFEITYNPENSMLAKLQQENQELKASLEKEILKAFQSGRNAGAIFKRAKDNEGLAGQYLKERIEALTKEK